MGNEKDQGMTMGVSGSDRVEGKVIGKEVMECRGQSTGRITSVDIESSQN